MATVRQNPLPVGRYWVWIAAAKEPVFLAFRVKYPNEVKVESNEVATHDGYGAAETRSGTTYIFSVSSPVQWPSGIGFPNTADGTIQKPADVLQRGQVPSIAETVSDWAAGLTGDATTLILIGFCLFLLFRSNKS